MARTEGDTWDLANSVGATATMVAAARAAATRRPQPVMTDEFAEPLVRAVGLDVFTRIAAGELDFVDVEGGVGFPRMVDTFAARAKYFDDYFADGRPARACARSSSWRRAGFPPVSAFLAGRDDGVRDRSAGGDRVQDGDAVGDSAPRPPPNTARWASIFARIGRRRCGQAGFDTAQPTAWLAEGVLIGFLPPEAEVRLLDNIIALSGCGQPAGRRLRASRRVLGGAQAAGAAHDRGLAPARTRSGHRQPDLSGRAHRCRRSTCERTGGTRRSPTSPNSSPPPACPNWGRPSTRPRRPRSAS